MNRPGWCVLFVSVSIYAQSATGAQTAKAVTASDGPVQVIFPTRPGVCGDGESIIRTWRHGSTQTYVGSNVFNGRDGWTSRPCVEGPGRVLASIVNGEVTRLSVFVGPTPRTAADTRTLTATAADASAWLTELAQRGSGRAPGQAIHALMLVDAPAPWAVVLRIARDDGRPRDARQSAVTWLSYGVTDKLGLGDIDDHASDDDEMRSQAVFVLSQRPKSESVPQLVELVRTAKNAAVRKNAIFWLGQSGDPRATDVFAELLGLR